MLEKILVPLDGSALSEQALIYAKELAVAFDSEVQLLSVVEKQDEEYRRMVQVYLNKIAEEMQSYFSQNNPKVTIKPIVSDGNPAIGIVEYARQKKVSLVIINSHGHSGIMPWSMGSTANKVIQTIHNPVLLIRASAGAKRPQVRSFKKILLPLDGSEIGEAALPYAREIAKKFKSEIILLSVVESNQHVRTIGGQDYIHYPEQQVESMKVELKEYLIKTSQKFSEFNLSSRVIVREGDAAVEIIRFAREGKISLVAMSSHGRSGMRGWVFGSVSNKVLQAGKTPLMLVGVPQK